MEDPYPSRKYPDSKFGFVLFFVPELEGHLATGHGDSAITILVWGGEQTCFLGYCALRAMKNNPVLFWGCWDVHPGVAGELHRNFKEDSNLKS